MIKYGDSMSLNEIVELDREARKLKDEYYAKGKPEKIRKEILRLSAVLEAKLDKIAPKIIRDIYRNFRIDIVTGFPVDADDFEKGLDYAFSRLLPNMIYIKEFKIDERHKSKLFIEIEHWDLNLSIPTAVFEPTSYAVSYVGALICDISVPSEDVPLKWRSKIWWVSGNKLIRVLIYTS